MILEKSEPGKVCPIVAKMKEVDVKKVHIGIKTTDREAEMLKMAF